MIVGYFRKYEYFLELGGRVTSHFYFSLFVNKLQPGHDQV